MTVLLKWFPPSWLQIKTKEITIYIDLAYLRTYFTHCLKRIEFSKWPGPIDGLPEALETADVILITHHHKDHVKRVTVDRLRRLDTLIVAPQRCVKELGGEVKTITAGEEIACRHTRIRAVDSYNIQEGNSTQKVHRKGHGVGYVLTLKGKTLYHGGDTDFIPEMKALGSIDVALLPIGGTFTMDISEAIKAALTIKPRIVIPMHHLKADPQEFKRKLETKSDIKVEALQNGEVYRL